jgi:hypothetical protein
MEIRPVRAAFFHRTDGLIDMTKQTVAFRNFANSPTKKVHILEIYYVLKQASRPNPGRGGGKEA